MSRRPALVKVQIARKELGLADDDYRMILTRLTGHSSATDCSDADLGRVLDEFKAKGWAPKVVAGGRAGARKPQSRKARPADHPSAKKARALWLSLWNLGEVRDPSEAALEAFARRQLKVERLQWADQGLTYKLIEALKAMAERAGWSQDLSGVASTEQTRTLKIRLVEAQIRQVHSLSARAWRPIAPHTSNEHQLDIYVRSLGDMIRSLQDGAR